MMLKTKVIVSPEYMDLKSSRFDPAKNDIKNDTLQNIASIKFNVSELYEKFIGAENFSKIDKDKSFRMVGESTELFGDNIADYFAFLHSVFINISQSLKNA